jgi:transglutaminase-like putative cysteine protease
MRLLATHITRYWYSDPVSTCHTEVHLAPRPRLNQRVYDYKLTISPQPDSVSTWQDFFGNEVSLFSIDEPHRELIVTSRWKAELAAPPPPHLELSPPWEEVRKETASRATRDAFEASQFVFESPMIQPVAALAPFAEKSFPAGRHFLVGVSDLSRRIHKEFQYDQRATTVSTPVSEVFERQRGVCQDFAHLMIACLRSLGLPARYVSGYVRSGREFTGSEASHAWLSVWCPMFGWQDFDPTNNVMPLDNHLTVAWGRDYSDVTPVKGVALGGGEQVINVSVDVSAVSS